MALRSWLLLSLALAAPAFAADPADGAGESDTGVCVRKMPAPPQCRWIEGTLSIYNGTPPIRIRQRGRKTIYAVGPAEQEWMPGSLRSKLTLDNEVQARLKICPMPDGPHRGLREVCVDEAQDVRVTAPRR